MFYIVPLCNIILCTTFLITFLFLSHSPFFFPNHTPQSMHLATFHVLTNPLYTTFFILKNILQGTATRIFSSFFLDSDARFSNCRPTCWPDAFCLMFQPLQALIAGEGEEEEGARPFYVLSDTHLQKWLMSPFSPEKVNTGQVFVCHHSSQEIQHLSQSL